MKDVSLPRDVFLRTIAHRVGDNRRLSYQSTNVDHKLIETVFSIAIFCHWRGKWQLKTLFLKIFLSTLIYIINIFDCRLPGVIVLK